MIFDEFENGMAAILAPALEPRGVTSVTGKDLSIHFLAVITAKSHFNQRFLSDGIARVKHYLNLLLAEKYKSNNN